MLNREAKRRRQRDDRRMYPVKYRIRQKEQRQKNIYLMQELKSVPCADCQRIVPYYCMDFDHRPGEVKHSLLRDRDKHGNVQKDRGMSHLLSVDRAAFLEEVKKCDVICAICHRIRTHERNDYARRHAPVAEDKSQPYMFDMKPYETDGN